MNIIVQSTRTIDFEYLKGEDSMTQSMRSKSGGIVVHTTDRGLPTAVKLERRELRAAPEQLAHEILTLCQLSAKRAQVDLRRELLSRGLSESVIRVLHLCTEAQLDVAESEYFNDEGEPGYLAPDWNAAR
ncbi:hypothetical protein [Mycobacterium sp. 3519A]|uniref:hypothetical protein n=1 Tax=Mycobacterium sp. 3519A TaxID=2057184 RepID=UPI00135CDA9C|nr:hypothetical protein [Mycobacterium sp. 3519A]